MENKYLKISIYEFEDILEEIMKQTFINEQLVEDHFKGFTKHKDLEFSEFWKAIKDINLGDIEKAELEELYDKIKGKNRRLLLEDIDAAVQCTVKKNIEECQKLVLDDVYSSIKSDAKLSYDDIFDSYEATGSNKITYEQFVTALEPITLNVLPVDLILLAKRYWTKYDNEIYYKDLIKDLEKAASNIDPTKEWIEEVWINIQKSLACKNESLYNFFIQYANKDDRIQMKEFHHAMKALNIDEIYDKERLDSFYYYWDTNKSEVVSVNEMQRTVRQYWQKTLPQFIDDILNYIRKKLEDKDISFADFEEDLEKLLDSRGKNYQWFII